MGMNLALNSWQHLGLYKPRKPPVLSGVSLVLRGLMSLKSLTQTTIGWSECKGPFVWYSKLAHTYSVTKILFYVAFQSTPEIALREQVENIAYECCNPADPWNFLEVHVESSLDS